MKKYENLKKKKFLSALMGTWRRINRLKKCLYNWCNVPQFYWFIMTLVVLPRNTLLVFFFLFGWKEKSISSRENALEVHLPNAFKIMATANGGHLGIGNNNNQRLFSHILKSHKKIMKIV